MRNNKEYELCKAISTYLCLQYPKVLFHFDLAGLNLSMAQAGMNKAIQKRKGFPDLFIMEPKNSYNGLFLELKAEGVKLTKRDGNWINDHIKEQADYLCELQERGFDAKFSIGFDETKINLDNYLCKTTLKST